MARKRRGTPLHGWLVIDKDPGLTSAQVVARVRRLTDAAKAGHAGTLDPLASGILPVALGEATKTVSFAQDGAKSYRFTVKWGESRDTDDSQGSVTASSAVRPTKSQILDILQDFTGEIEQVPPDYSAIKVAGERAYDLAREGADLALEPRKIRIDRLVLDGIVDADHAEFTVDCGKGAYVRGLARDFGVRLGCLGHIVQLRRTRVGPFGEDQAISLAKLEELCNTSAPPEFLLPVVTVLDDIPALALTGPQADRLKQGQTVRVLGFPDGIACAMNAGLPVAITEISAGEVRPVRVFNL